MGRSITLLGVALMAAGGGSGGPAPAGPPVYPVVGTLLVGDRPAGNASVAFHPVGGGPLCPVGRTGPDGSFRLTTRTFADGAPAGEYVVTLLWPRDDAPTDDCGCEDPVLFDRLRGRYSTAADSDLRATVGPGPNALTLRAAVGATGWNLPRRSAGGR